MQFIGFKKMEKELISPIILESQLKIRMIGVRTSNEPKMKRKIMN